MAGGLTVSVRQIASYPQATVSPGDLVLLQQAGMGGPYISSGAYAMVRDAVASGGPLGIGFQPPANAWGGGLFLDEIVVPNGGGVLYNIYFDTSGPGGPVQRYWQNGVGSGSQSEANGNFIWAIAPPGIAGAVVPPMTTLMSLSPAGALALPLGTLSVARDPGSALEVATMGWVGRMTVGSFNGRRGAVTLDACDIGLALGYPAECIATIPQVNEAICQAIQDLIHTYPAVWSWNGRVGDVWLTLQDINNVLATAGAPIIVPTPPTDANDGEAVNAGWVTNYVTSLLAGPPAYATQPWVQQQIAAINLGVTSFNGRLGAVVLQYLDIASLGFAPVNSPSFSGIPSAPTATAGNSSSQLATTAFVMNAVTAATTGVISWQGRTGAVDMVLSDITSVGGAPTNSPNFVGIPSAPTAALGTSTQQIATTAFVMNEITASTGGVVSFNGRSGVVTLLTADITAAGGAPNANPALTGIPTAPTAANGTATQQLATTAFVMNEIGAISAGVTTFNGRSGAVTLNANDISAAGGLANPSPQLTGTGSTYPTSVTTAPSDNSTNIATTAFVQAAIANIGGGYLPLTGGANMSGLFNLSGNATGNLNPVPLQQLNAAVAGLAPLTSPAFSGTPTAPTATAGTATQQLATTAFVTSALGGYLPLTGGTLSGPLTTTQPAAGAPWGLTVTGNINNSVVANISNSNTGAAAAAAVNFSSGSAAATVQYNGSLNAMVLAAAGGLNMGSLNLQANTINLGGNAVLLSTNTRYQLANGAYFTNTGSPDLGYNITSGGVGTYSFSLVPSIDPIWRWLSGGVTQMTLDSLNHLIVSGVVTGNGGVSVPLNTRYTLGNGSYLSDTGTAGGGGFVLTQNPAGYQFALVPSIDPVFRWSNGGTLQMSLNSASNLSVAGTISQGSDETTKNTIAPYAPGVSIASQLLPKTFIYNTDPDNTQHLGFIAQDVQPLVPAAVGSMGATLSLDVTAIVAVMANAIKQLISRVQALEAGAGVTPSAAELA